jgi:fructoselysine 6-kinase
MTRGIATVGDNCIDRYLPPVDRTLVGGNAVNVAVQLVRLGHDTAYFGAVGDDAEGARMRAVLGRIGVDLAGLKTIRPGRSSVTVISSRKISASAAGIGRMIRICDGSRP